MTTKQCITCKEIKDIAQFGRNRSKDSTNFTMTPNYKNECKPCLSIKAKAYRDSQPGLWKKYRNNPNGKNAFFAKDDALLVSAIRNRIHNAKRNSTRDVTITDQYMYKLWNTQQGLCALSGVPLRTSPNSHLSLSIDQIVPSAGYVEGNVQWVSTAVNRMKSDMNMPQLLALCKRILETCRDYPEKE